ncbi:MAG: SH3 domain-containing protein [Deltaproteobacteria bacterium]|nr:SH3 domain-containing protein [Deltaproteobacteria bacterium]
MRACISLLFGSLLVAAAPVHAETVDQAYQGALGAYYKGDYAGAAEGLERLEALPLRHAALYYNLGCAYFRLGQLGRAIYNFERALALEPSSVDAAHNLEVVRRIVGRKVKDVLKGVQQQSLVDSWLRGMESGGWWTLFLVLWWSMFAMLFALRFVKAGPARAGVIAVNSFVALLAFVAALFLAGRIHLDRATHDGILLPERVEVREGPTPSARSTFKLHAGHRVRLEGESAGWVRIRLPNGLEGWVKRQDVGVL